jgi:hypothetical protein
VSDLAVTKIMRKRILRQPSARGSKQRELSLDALAILNGEPVGEDGTGQSFDRSGHERPGSIRRGRAPDAGVELKSKVRARRG